MFSLTILFFLLVGGVITTCPPDSGIYLILNGECRSNGTYFRDSDLDISKENLDNHLHCVLPGETLDDGEWLRPDGQPVNCNDVTDPDPFLCFTNITSLNANITLYLSDDDYFAPLIAGNKGIELQYKCCLPTNCSDPNTNIMIINVFERVYITDIYVDLPSNITVIPQYYTIHCIVTGQENPTFTHYYDSNPDIEFTNSSCDNQLGYNCIVNSELLYTINYTYDKTLTIEWEAEKINSGAFVSTNYNGDHVHGCSALRDINSNKYRNVKFTITAPSSSPSNLTLVSNTFTSITINWTYPDISDTDGYVVNASSLNDYVIQQVNGSSVNETTLNGLIPGTTYNITIRAYQDLLGPASQPLSVTTIPDTVANLSYAVNGSNAIINWDTPLNGGMISSYFVRHTFCDEDEEHIKEYSLNETTTQYILTDFDYNVTNNITVITSNGIGNSSTSILTNITVPSPPPPNISAVALNHSAISVTWDELPCENNRKIIMYTIYAQTLAKTLAKKYTMNVSANHYAVVFSNLDSNTTYNISMATLNDAGYGYHSDDIPVNLSTPQAVLSSNNILTMTGIDSSITATYTSNIYSSRQLQNISPLISLFSEVQTFTSYTSTINSASTTETSTYSISEHIVSSLISSSELITFTSYTSTITPDSIAITSLYSTTEAESSTTETSTYSISEHTVSSLVSSPSSELITFTSYTSTIITPDSVAITSSYSRTEVESLARETSINDIYSINEHRISSLISSPSSELITFTSYTSTIITPDSVAITSSYSRTEVESSTTEPYTIKTSFIGQSISSFLSSLNDYVTETNIKSQDNITITASVSAVFVCIVIIGLVVALISLILITRLRKKKSLKNLSQKHSSEVEMSLSTKTDNLPVDDVLETEFQCKINGSQDLLILPITEPEYAVVKDVQNTYENINKQRSNSYTVSHPEAIGVEIQSYDHNIKTTIPVSLSELSSHVNKCHEENNNEFHEQYKSLYTGEELSCSIGMNENITKLCNRFKNITPYNCNRIILQSMDDIEDCQRDYINASFIDGYSQAHKYIAAQGPLEKTLVDFWRLIWQEKPQVIVMVTNLREGVKSKCERYWPSSSRQKSFGPFDVTLLGEKITPDFVIRKLTVQANNSESIHTVTQFHLTSWPDHGVPESVSPLMKFHQQILNACNTRGGPLLVHCSAGVGRTGTFITLDIALEQANKEGIVDIPGIVNRLRQQRMKMVQTEAQYVFVHEAVLECVLCGDTSIPSNNFKLELNKLKHLDPVTSQTGLEKQYKLLDVTYSKHYFTTALENMEKNRSKQHLPSERWRVQLIGEYPNYINAVFIPGYNKKKAFIIAQSPMENTTRDFWRMIIDYKVSSIIMCCDLQENGKEVCFQYWSTDERVLFGEYIIKCEQETDSNGFIQRQLIVTNSQSNSSHSVVQFHFKDWSDNGKVTTTHTVIKIFECVITTQQRSGEGPVVVHCSDTVSRSGVYCAVSNAIEQCKTEGVVDVFQTVKNIRMNKPGAVSTLEQYHSVYDVIETYIEDTSTYSNFTL